MHEDEYGGPERRLTTTQRLDAIEHDIRQQFTAGALRMDKMDKAIEANTQATDQVVKNTSEMLEAFNNMKGAFNAFNVLGRIAKPFAAIVTAFTSVYAAYLLYRGKSPLE